MKRIYILAFLLCSTWMVAQSKISDNQIRTPPPLACADTSSSGTTQVCTTAPSYTPAAGNCVVYTTTTTNTGALTLNVNSQGAKPVQKWLGTALVAGDVVLNKPQTICYDGSNWQLGTIGNAPSAGGVTSITCNAGLSGGTITSTGTCALATSAVGSTGMILLEEHTGANTAELDFTTCISSTYDNYRIEYINLYPATNATIPILQVHTVSGYDTGSNYSSGFFYYAVTASANGGVQNATTSITLWLGGGNSVPNSGNSGVSGYLDLYNPANASNYKFFLGQSIALNSNDTQYYAAGLGAIYKTTTAVDGFRVLMLSGNVTSGTVRCYGYTK